jgi:diamine N-acetyltransferase
MAPTNPHPSAHPLNATIGRDGTAEDRTRDILPEAAIEAIARSLFKEGQQYGFRQVDYLRLVSHLLDLSGRGDARDRQPDREIESPHGTAPPQMPLQGAGVCIRAFEAATDRALLARWLEEAHGKYFLLSSITAKTLALDQILRSDQNRLGVITLPDATPIGMMAFLDVDRWQQKAELRKLIGEPGYRGRGFARQATTLWIHYGLFGLGLKKIYLNTLQTDIRNIRLNEAVGFRVEGILRKEYYIDGEYHDVLRMALLNE